MGNLHTRHNLENHLKRAVLRFLQGKNLLARHRPHLHHQHPYRRRAAAPDGVLEPSALLGSKTRDDGLDAAMEGKAAGRGRGNRKKALPQAAGIDDDAELSEDDRNVL